MGDISEGVADTLKPAKKKKKKKNYGNEEEIKNFTTTTTFVGKSQEVNQVARDLLFRLRKKDYDFSTADTACNASFSILRRREGDGDEKNAKNGAKESKSAKMDDINSDEGCDDFDGKTGCVVSDSVGVSVVIADSEAKLDPEVGCDDVETEPASKKAKLEDSSAKRLGPVSDADLIPLKPKVTDQEINLFFAIIQVRNHLPTDPDPAISKSLSFR
jgi:hypothetical protein